MNIEKPRISLAISRARVKIIKDALDAHDLLDKRIKITPLPQGESFSIPLKRLPGIGIHDKNEPSKISLFQFLSSIGMERYVDDVALSVRGPLACDESDEGPDLDHTLVHNTTSNGRRNPLDLTIDAWLKSIPASTPTQHTNGNEQESLDTAPDVPIFDTASSYTVYPPMLLLPHTALSDCLGDGKLSRHLPRLYETLHQVFKVTHIALNAPIPTSSSGGESPISKSEDYPVPRPNILRSPTRLTPLYGDFGVILSADHVPIPSDFESAFWCTTRQNGIFQTWAPRYTMFSRGNISEKARILDLVSSCHQFGPDGTRAGFVVEQATAIDLYAGIGYFAFSYAKAGVAKILCWDINPWSIEGLKRGARMNKWTATTLNRHEYDDAVLRRAVEEDYKMFIFQESNEYATTHIQTIRDHIPPIRHVNCGYLPSSIDSWKTAVEALDPQYGGWIHAHENIAKKEIEQRKRKIVNIFTDLVREVHGLDNVFRPFVSCEHLQRVKSYAPGVIHCVLDIAITSSPGE